MKGAHCLVCLEDGPDLVIEPQQLPPPGLRAEMLMTFECNECHRWWTWRVTHRGDGSITYINLPVPETVQ